MAESDYTACTKRCTSCNLDLHPSDFYARSGGGLKAACKKCTKEYMRRIRAQPKEERMYGVCKTCGGQFVRNGKVSAYCSPACKAEYRRPVSELVCRISGCGRPTKSGVSDICHTHYSRQWVNEKMAESRAAAAMRPCATCGQPTGDPKRRKYCSKKCRDGGEVTRGIRRAVGRAYMYAKRSREVVRFDPFEVFDRDGWRCRLCGVATPKSLRGKSLPRSPELDHIVPISKGGVHAPWNTQCLCRKCNRAKSDKAIGQLGLALVDTENRYDRR